MEKKWEPKSYSKSIMFSSRNHISICRLVNTTRKITKNTIQCGIKTHWWLTSSIEKRERQFSFIATPQLSFSCSIKFQKLIFVCETKHSLSYSISVDKSDFLSDSEDSSTSKIVKSGGKQSCVKRKCLT